MNEMNTLAAFKAINEDIKAVLRDLDDKISEHTYLENKTMNQNNEAFIEMLDQLLQVQSTIEELKKHPLS